MEIDIKEIKRLEKLSAISFTDEKLESFKKDFNSIANFVEQIKAFNEEVVEDYSNSISIKNLREDEIIQSLSQEEILANAPEKGEGAFVVPKVVD